MKKSKILMMVGALFLLGLFLFPLWNITLEAPQYPDPIGMDIWITKIADHNPNDLKNINLMNHYIGMKPIPETMIEFKIFPIVIVSMCLLGLLIGFLGKPKLYLVWFFIMLLFGIVGMYDFYLWEYDYGHNLSEKAAIKFVDAQGSPLAYQPPLIGSKMILNFKAISIPMLGAYFLFVGLVLSVVAFFISKKE